MGDLTIRELAATLEMARKFVVQNNCFTISARKEALAKIDQTLTRAASPNAQSTPAEAGRGKGYSA